MSESSAYYSVNRYLREQFGKKVYMSHQGREQRDPRLHLLCGRER